MKITHSMSGVKYILHSSFYILHFFQLFLTFFTLDFFIVLSCSI